LVTPAFLQSEWCCREVALFREREASLGRDDLVFPIHWVDTEHVDPASPADCHDKAIFDFLRSRQWSDFRPLRRRNLDSEDAGQRLETLAIRTALRRADPPATSREPAKAAAVERTDPPKTQAALASAELLPPLVSTFRRLGRPHNTLTTPETYAAYAYRRGREALVRKEYAKAMRWYRVAADGGDDEAQFTIAMAYEHGDGLEQDYAEAMRWYRKAADQGNIDAQYEIGLLYANGLGVPRDLTQAQEWMQKAANGDDEDTKKWLADNPG